MVNLPAISLRNVQDDDRERLRTRSHHAWGMRLGRSREEMKRHSEPTGLHQLEKLARRSVRLMEKHGTKTPNSYVHVMDLLRQQYNMVRIACYNYIDKTIKLVYVVYLK